MIDAKMMKRIAKTGESCRHRPVCLRINSIICLPMQKINTSSRRQMRRSRDNKEFVRDRVSCRYHSGFIFSTPESVDYMDVAPHQIVGISAALIPFLEHDDANRALMGSNMQAQAVPLVRPGNAACLHGHGIPCRA